MTLKLYDTLTRQKRDFVPIDPANVRLYVCGPTVYDFAHIGNARPVIVFDVLFRLLRHLAKQGVWDGGKGETKVTYVRNITDVDDKINERAARDFPGLPLNEAIREVTTATGEQFHKDIAALGALPPTQEPRATEHIAEMRAIIEKLVQGGFAYVAGNHVLFSPAAMDAAPSNTLPRYGALANRSLDEMIAGARVDVAPYKRAPTDFVLWKPSKPGEPSWPSPAGIAVEGRPGWHIECSAMADKWLWEEAKATLGESGLAHPHQFDIHGGGIDLVFPHHENEVAQSTCAFGQAGMANYWMHNGFLQVEGQKMSKSLGNFVTIDELLQQRPNDPSWGEIIRLNMLRTHYRQPIDWTEKGLLESQTIYQVLRRSAQRVTDTKVLPSEAMIDALCEDLNTPKALAEVQSLARRARSADIRESPRDAANQLVGSLIFLGFRHAVEHIQHQEGARTGIAQAVETKIAARNAARAAKDWAEADRIRKELDAMGIAVKDNKDGTSTWEVKR